MLTRSVAVRRGSTLAIDGESRRSMIAWGKCQSRSTTRSPASVPRFLAIEGPTPGRVSMGANRGNRMAGRMKPTRPLTGTVAALYASATGGGDQGDERRGGDQA